MRFAKDTGIRASRKPQLHSSLSGVVIVNSEQGRGCAFIKFDEKLVRQIGEKMPQGVGPANPAFLKVIQMGALWRIYAMYLRKTRGVLLSQTTEKPEWLEIIPVGYESAVEGE